MIVVFTGPSLDAISVRAELPRAQVEAPACRGDVDRVVAQGATTILLIDGGFGHRFAVAPSEIVRALRAGVDVVGAASLGAIRAAECYPAGMRGIGAIQRLYRLRVFTDDDEVAVATEPDRGFRASSIPLVNVRFAVLAALRAGLVRHGQAEAMLTVARRLHFSERLWEPILDAAGRNDHAALRDLCLATDIKRRDAQRAVAHLAAYEPRPATRRPTPGPDRAPETWFGRSRERARDELVGWLAASGRYRRYWTQAPADREGAWEDLAARGELDFELMRWYAVLRGAEVAEPGEEGESPAARAAIASAHGFAGWEALTGAAVDGVLPGGVPAADVDDAVRRLTRARRGLTGLS